MNLRLWIRVCQRLLWQLPRCCDESVVPRNFWRASACSLVTHSLEPLCCTYAAGVVHTSGLLYGVSRMLSRSREAKLSSLPVSAAQVLATICKPSSDLSKDTPTIDPCRVHKKKQTSVRWLGRRPSDATHCALHASHSHTLAHSSTEHSAGTRSCRASRSSVHLRSFAQPLLVCNIWNVNCTECKCRPLFRRICLCFVLAASRCVLRTWGGWSLIRQRLSRVQACLSAIFDSACRSGGLCFCRPDGGGRHF